MSTDHISQRTKTRADIAATILAALIQNSSSTHPRPLPAVLVDEAVDYTDRLLSHLSVHR